MAQIDLDDTRKEILETEGHLLITGGPGCGKTTAALLHAKSRVVRLETEQRILFLSFSRAAVRQVLDRMAGTLTRSEREKIEVRTFHAFFLDLLRSHGRLLTGVPLAFITPGREAQRRADHDGDWNKEATRLAMEESIFVFDTLATFTADLIERCADVRRLYSARYPLIVVDEFQDTNREQWRVIKSLAEDSAVVCLADPDQRIFDHLEGVDEQRLTELMETLSPVPFDLSRDNHRSPSSGILEYANAVLRTKAASAPENVLDWRYNYQSSDMTLTHWGVIAARDALIKHLGRAPTIAVLTRTNVLAGRISETLSEDRVTPAGKELPAVEHALAWDPELAAASALVVSSILEWPLKQRIDAVTGTLGYVADYYRTKLGNGTQGARGKVTTLKRAIGAVQAERRPASKTARILLEQFDRQTQLTGQPVQDWQAARTRLAGSAELDEIYRQARLIRLLKATDALAWTLLAAWDGASGYRQAADVVRITLADEAVNIARVDTPTVSVMTMHKSKGKEFDGVLIVEGRHQGQFFDEDHRHHGADRRLLRVAITRARHLVAFIRPGEAKPLTPPRS